MTAREGQIKRRSLAAIEVMSPPSEDKCCGFCGRPRDDVEYLAEGPITCICVECAENVVSLARATLSAPAPDEVVLRVRWEWDTDGEDDHDLTLTIGKFTCGIIWADGDGTIYGRMFSDRAPQIYPTLAAAQAALVERAKGGGP